VAAEIIDHEPAIPREDLRVMPRHFGIGQRQRVGDVAAYADGRFELEIQGDFLSCDNQARHGGKRSFQGVGSARSSSSIIHAAGKECQESSLTWLFDLGTTPGNNPKR
jgi:hypothetical protein